MEAGCTVRDGPASNPCMRRRRWRHAALLLVCGTLWACGGKRGLLVGDGGGAELGGELGAAPDSAPPGSDAGAEVGTVDSPVEQPAATADTRIADSVTADGMVADRVGDPRGPSVPETEDARLADIAAEAWPGDERPPALDLGTTGEASGPVTASPSGGCVPGVVSPSLAYRGVVGIDFDEDGIADEVDRCPALATSSQDDGDGDGLGDACDRCDGGGDGDQDGVCDDADNCPVDWNPGQYDTDGDRIGNRCDSPRCFSAPASEDLQRILQRLLRKPEFTAPLVDAHWRVLSTRTYCRNDAMAVSLQIIDYRQRKLVTVGYLVEADEVLSVVVAELTDLQGPQPSAEEGREAVYLAERDPQVGAVLEGLRYRISSGAFFYEFGTQPENNDPAFSGCATGRCVDVLFGGFPPDGGYVDYSVVVEMGACRVLGIKPRP